MKVKQSIFVFILLLGLVICPGTALAHWIETDYQLISDSLEVQSIFSNGEVFQNAPVIVYSPTDPTQPWFEGTTDETGKFVFEPDPAIAGEWAVEIGEGGHWDRLRVPVGERGIDIDSISYLDRHLPHWHYPFANQFMVAGVVLCSSVGGRFVSRKLRRFHHS